MAVTDRDSRDDEDRQRFLTTQWSVVLAARDDESRPALAALCESYWYPLYAYIRHRGCDAEQARDLTQEFFATLLEKDYLQGVDPQRGRFRTFLLVVLQRFLAKDFRASLAEKRGGGRPVLPLDFALGERQYANEPITEVTAEQIFERRWALTLLERVLAKLEQEYRSKGKEQLFRELNRCLTAELDAASHQILGERLGMSVGAVKTAAFRFRQRYRDILRDEVAQTVAEGDDVDEELRHLREVVSRG
jgi:DNA-directed RNA polymerase specialized sigma24 family protein